MLKVGRIVALRNDGARSLAADCRAASEPKKCNGITFSSDLEQAVRKALSTPGTQPFPPSPMNKLNIASAAMSISITRQPRSKNDTVRRSRNFTNGLRLENFNRTWNFASLNCCLTVIEARGYAPAGKLLHISHSAIHRQIRMLEQELDCPLLARSGRTVKATEPARLLVDLALQIRQEIAEVRRRVSDLNDLRQGCLRIGTSSSILVSFLPAVLQRFSKKFPAVRLHLITGVADDLIEDRAGRGSWT